MPAAKGTVQDMLSCCRSPSLRYRRLMTMTHARYDGYADWYDDFNAPFADANAVELADILGPGHGLCLDLGCGTGHNLDAIAATGRNVVGLDFSADQLRIASRRPYPFSRADAARLPFKDQAFRTVVAMWISTDVDDFAAVLRETARVLTPGGTFVFWGVHPCFNGPHIERGDDETRIIHRTYREAGWHTESPWWGHNIRRKVGMRHVPLAQFLNAFIAAGLTIEEVREPEEIPVPYAIAIRATRI
jgi:ubiquinone/menaquinone biosynthesis C-methylase UbiE